MKDFDRILMCDDDDIARFINRELFKDMNLSNEIIEATNGEEAVEKLHLMLESKKTGRPDLVFLDLNMPGLSGLEVLDWVSSQKGWKRKFHIVVLTSSVHTRDLEKALKHKISCYLSKPLTEEKIKKALIRVEPKRRRKYKAVSLQPSFV